MLTMRPRRAFIMPRITALQLRKTLVRLVSRIACQSSSFIRISRLSRVMPALLTRIEIAPISLPTASTSASIAPAPLTSSLRPWPPDAARRWPIAAAPASLVAVPMTVSPCAASSSAMAAPMPGLAPVTSAISPCNVLVILSFPETMVAGPCPARGGDGSAVLPLGQRGVEFTRRAERARIERLVDPSRQPGEHLARPAFAQARDAHARERLDHAGPLHRQVQLPHQRIADRLQPLVHLGVDVLHHRQFRLAPRQAAHGFAQAIGGLAHQ